MTDFSALVASMDGTIRDSLGEAVTYSPSVGSPVTVTGLFDRAAVHADVGEVGVASQGPVIWLVLSDLPSNPFEDPDALITVGATTYRIFDPMPDGKGSVRVKLHENA